MTIVNHLYQGAPENLVNCQNPSSNALSIIYTCTIKYVQTNLHAHAWKWSLFSPEAKNKKKRFLVRNDYNISNSG